MFAEKAQVTLTNSVTLYAKWSLVSYTITYNLNGGTNDPENPTSYTVASGAVTLKAPTRTGYDFAGWTLNGSKITEIASGSIGSKTLTATWTPITYTITYNLDGGTASNPESYTIESESFTLNNPAKTGYTFAGWTGTDLTAVTQAVTIAKGSTGDRVYTANYTQNQAALSTIEVSVTGALTLTTTEGTAATSAYTASVTGKYSDGTSAALTDYSIEWTLDKNISGIQISNNGTLSVNGSVKAGTYALTITARATKDSVTGSGTRSVNLTVNAQKQEEQKQEEQQQEEQPAETATLESLGVSITGSDNLIVKEQETLTSTYTASVTGTYSDSTTKTLAASDYSLEWTLEPKITGVSVSDGTLRVSDRALAGKYTFTITVKATHDSITGSFTKGVNLEVLERRKTIDAEYLENMTTEEKNAVEYLALSDNPDKQITDLSQIDFTDFTNLNTLDLSELKNLDEADLSQLPENVKTVNLEKTNITSLNLNGSTVERVNANGCKNLMNIDAEDNESLTDLDVSDTSITVINVKNCTNLQTLNCSSCDLEAGNLNLEGCTNLVSLDISRNHFGWFDYDPSSLSSMTNLECNSQDIIILESSKTFNFGQFFNSGDITVAGVRVMASAYIGSIGNVTAYNESGDRIASDYDPQTGTATFESAPDVIKYLYDTGFDDLSMDVTINALTHTEEQEQEPEAGYNPSLGSSGGSCNVGLSLSSLLFAVFLFVKKR